MTGLDSIADAIGTIEYEQEDTSGDREVSDDDFTPDTHANGDADMWDPRS